MLTTYSAIVRHPGNLALFDAVEMSLLALLSGWPLHLHAEGVRGTGKTTVLRAARALLPPLERIAGCPYNCRPDRPHCPLHRELDAADIAAIGTETVPRPFLEISHSAKLGTVAGSIDLGRLSSPDGMTAALLPGTLPQAHRGVVIVDEINRLAETAPELADMLLDAMGTRPGRVQIEEAGLPHVAVPVELVVWAASNPDEDPGPLSAVRRQLSDRFDLNVGLERPPGPEWVEQVLARLDDRLQQRRHAAAAPPAAAGPSSGRVGTLAGDVATVAVPAPVRRVIAELYSRFALESLRAAEGLHIAARAAALRAGRQEVTVADVRRAAPLVLRHRLEPERLQRCLQFLDDAAVTPAGKAVPALPGRAAAVASLPGPSAAAPATASPPPAAVAGSPATVPSPDQSAAAAPRGGVAPAALPPPSAPRSQPAKLADPPLLQRFWQRLSGQAASPASGDGGRAAAGQPPGLTNAPADPSALAPPAPARPLRQLPPERWLAGPEQLWPHD